MANPRNLNRVDSICPQPDEVLLDYVKKNDLDKIKLLIHEHGNLINNVYDHPYYKPILHIACSEDNISPKTVQLLLNLGADPCIESDDEGEAIHIAARSARSEILNVLIENTNCINHLYEGNTALLELLKEGDTNNRKEFLESAKILIEKGVDINKTDSKNMTAILWTIKKKIIELIEVFINNRPDIDLDTTTLDGKTARQLILENKLLALTLPSQNEIKPENVLLKYLKDDREDLFVNYNFGNLKQYRDVDDGQETLLQVACKRGLKKAVEHLLQNGANTNLTTLKTRETPLELASKNGYSQIVEQLLNADHSLNVSSDVITRIMKNINEPEYAECFKKLLNTQNESSLNRGNEFLNTPLHLAVRYGQSKHIHALLNKGASLASKNDFDIMPIQNIDPEILEEHLNNCIEIDDTNKDNPTVTLNFGTLIPPAKIPTGLDHNMEKGEDFEYTPVAESQAIAYMCETNHLKHLLIHPVIVTFLLLKWHKIRWLFFANLGFYIVFFLSLVIYIFTSYGNFHYIGNSQALSSISTIAYGFLCVTFFILIFRELFQIVVAPFKYYKDFENWIELTLIVLIGCILFTNDSGNDARKQLSSVAILLSAFELVLMMGQHPKLSTNVVMLKTVSFNFFKFLLWYSLLIIAFALSFYILFSEPVKEVKSGDDDDNSFVNPGSSVFKTFIMLTGEFDAGSINFNSFPVTSKLIFVLFILMIAITLLNLLNGLAVSDTQMIKNDAEYVGIVSRTQHVFYVESMLVGNMFPTTLINLFHTVCCCFTFARNTRYGSAKPFSNYVCLHPLSQITFSLNTPTIFYSNKNNLSRKRFYFRFDSIYLDSNIIVRTKKIIHVKKAKQEQNLHDKKMKEVFLKILDESNIRQDLDKIIKMLSSKRQHEF